MNVTDNKLGRPMYIKITNSTSNLSVIFFNTQAWVEEGYSYSDFEPKQNVFRLRSIPEGFDDMPQNKITSQSGAISNKATNTYTTYNPREMAIGFHAYSVNTRQSERSMGYLTNVLTTHGDDVLAVEVYFKDLSYGFLTYALLGEGQSITRGTIILNDMNENLFYKYTLNSSGESVLEYKDTQNLTVSQNGDFVVYRNLTRIEPVYIMVRPTTQQVVIRNTLNLGYLHKSTTIDSYFISDSFVNKVGGISSNWILENPERMKGAPIWLSPGNNYIRFYTYDNVTPNYEVTVQRFDTATFIPMNRLLGDEE